MQVEVAIVGGGPGGAAAALYLQRQGIQSTIVEKDRFPRYHIGESLTGECAACIRELGLEAEMNRIGHPIKRGVKVYGPDGQNAFYVPTKGRLAGGELFDTTAWQVRRSDFDTMLLDTAVQRGAQLVRAQAVKPLRQADGSICGIQVRKADGQEKQIEAQVLVDASGQATFLANAGIFSHKERGPYDKQIAIFSQVEGAVRDALPRRDDTLIFYRERNHWAWFIPLDEKSVSVGITCPSHHFSSQKKSKRDFLLRELRTVNPELRRRLVNFQLTESVRAISNYSYQVHNYTGRGYLAVGDAHRFVDPIFSFGVYVSIKEAEFAAVAIAQFLRKETVHLPNPFESYQSLCERGQDAAQALIDGFWDFPLAFGFFVHNRYNAEFIDLFSGRLYDEQPNRALLALAALRRGKPSVLETMSP